jgi:polyphosphate kinase
MPRNFRRRVEVMFPILDGKLRARLIDEILFLMRADNVKGWLLGSDGTYARVASKDDPIRCQSRFMELARERGREAEPRIIAKQFTAVTTPDTALEKLRTLRNKRRQKKRRK